MGKYHSETQRSAEHAIATVESYFVEISVEHLPALYLLDSLAKHSFRRLLDAHDLIYSGPVDTLCNSAGPENFCIVKLRVRS